MIKYTTPLLPLEVEGIDLTSDYDVYVTITQKGRPEVTKTGSDLTMTYDAPNTTTFIDFTMTQTETANFEEDREAEIQVNFVDENGVRDATDIATIPVLRNLLERTIEHGN